MSCDNFSRLARNVWIPSGSIRDMTKGWSDLKYNHQLFCHLVPLSCIVTWEYHDQSHQIVNLHMKQRGAWPMLLQATRASIEDPNRFVTRQPACTDCRMHTTWVKGQVQQESSMWLKCHVLQSWQLIPWQQLQIVYISRVVLQRKTLYWPLAFLALMILATITTGRFKIPLWIKRWVMINGFSLTASHIPWECP